MYETARFEILEHVMPGIPPQVGNIVVGLLVLLLTYLFASFVFGVVERLQRQAVQRGREVAALAAVIDERARLSRELHDGLAQLVAFLLVRLDTVSDLVLADRRPEALSELERLRGLADDLYLDVREAIAGLRSRVAERGLVPALRDYLDEFEERQGIQVALEADPAIHVPDLVGLHLFRIVQEALANIRKHAHAQQAWVRLRLAPRGLELEIGDDGVGFDPARATPSTQRSFGLTSMAERAKALGGELRIESAPGSGTQVHVGVPLVPLSRKGKAKDALAAATG
jgi:signal transduction histidine kinase